MALLDNLPNIFPTQEPDYLKGLLGDKYANLQNQATKSGLINAALTYLTLPKNQNLGTPNILARTFLGGMQGAQGVYDTKAKNLVEGLNVAKTSKQLEMEGMTELDKLIYNRAKLAEVDPTSPYLGTYDSAIAQKAGLYGNSVEGVSYNTLLKGNDGSAEAEARRRTPAYAVAYREAFAPKTVMQTVQDPITGVTKQVPVRVEQAPPPPNILPPIYGSGATEKTTTAAATTNAPTGTGGNVTSAPTALTPQQATTYKEKVDQSMLLSSTIQALKDDINKNGMQFFGLGFKGSKQASLYEDALTQIRIAAELGVLNKEDLPRLMKALPNPTDLSSYIKGGGTPSAVMGAFEAIEDRNKRQIEFYNNKLNPKQEKPAGAGGGLILDLNAISEELKRRKKGGS
jgi:hypothetical protein